MEYTIGELAQLSGVSTRTLRYYDEIGLLKPSGLGDNGYRLYSSAQVDRLQQILFYRHMEVSLDKIKALLSAPDFDREKALRAHLSSLLHRKEQIETLIGTVTRSICALEGGTQMNDIEKFEGFKRQLIGENEKKYGDEIRKLYGDDAVHGSNAKLMGMSAEKYSEAQRLSEKIAEALKAGMGEGDPAGASAQKACDLHRQWLCLHWADGTYSKQAHLGLGEMYASDERFKAHYEKIAPGATLFLLEALRVYCG